MDVLNKYLAHAGLCSRRKATEFIKDGFVTVNKETVDNPAYRVQPGDIVKYHDKIIKPEQKVYLLLNKPKDFITTVSDERGRKTVMDLIAGEVPGRIYPLGRLDRTTTGLLLMTNDGEFMQNLAHPRNGVEKIYHVILGTELSTQDLEKIREGLQLYDGRIKVDAISYLPGKRRNELKVVLHSGKYRVVRRIFESLNYEIRKLDRIGYAGLTKKGLFIGQWRYLEAHEVAKLKNY